MVSGARPCSRVAHLIKDKERKCLGRMSNVLLKSGGAERYQSERL